MTKPLLNLCLVTQNLASIIEDSIYDSDRFPDVSDISGEVIFTPNIANGKAYQLFDRGGEAYTVPVSRIRAQITNGKITHESSTGVYLFAAGAGSNPDTITYSVEYRNLRSGDISFSLSPLKFEAVPGGEVDLTTVTPVVGATPVGTTKGDKGDPGEVTLEQLNQAIRVDTSVGTRVFTGDQMIMGDTGTRDVSYMGAGFDFTTSTFHRMTLRRVGDQIFLDALGVRTSEDVWITEVFPQGFRPTSGEYRKMRGTVLSKGVLYPVGNSATLLRLSAPLGAFQIGESVVVNATWFTDNSWPTSLPGTSG